MTSLHSLVATLRVCTGILFCNCHIQKGVEYPTMTPLSFPLKQRWLKVEVGEGHKDLFAGTALSSRLPLSLHSHVRKEKKGDFATLLHLRVHLFPWLCRATVNSKWMSRPSYTCCMLFVPAVQGRIQVVGKLGGREEREYYWLWATPIESKILTFSNQDEIQSMAAFQRFLLETETERKMRK